VLGLWLISGDYAPGIASSGDIAGTVLVGAVLGLVVGLLEELGWTGFAIPRALQHYTVLGTGVLVGIMWGAWHFFVSYWGGGGTNGGIPASVFLSLWLVGLLAGQLTAYRVLMVWLYERTGSLLLAVLMHASLTTFQFILNPLTPGWPQQVYPLGYAATAWVVVAAVGAGPREEVSTDRSAARLRGRGLRAHWGRALLHRV
jgi:membrane protease YdiL (CAAX protease family)